jgi:DNA-directed RNA polymerase specialized sigma24 family protein
MICYAEANRTDPEPARRKLMASQGDISGLVAELKAGKRDAAGPLWDAYYRRLMGLARAKLGRLPRRVIDEEDVALSAFDSFCRGAKLGCFPRLEDRADLWQVLGMITARKTADLHKYLGRKKRGEGQVRGDSALLGNDSQAVGGLDGLPGEEQPPDVTCAITEECQRLLDCLPDETLRQVVLGKLAGYSNPELAEQLKCSLASVGRKLGRVRRAWKRLLKEKGESFGADSGSN